MYFLMALVMSASMTLHVVPVGQFKTYDDCETAKFALVSRGVVPETLSCIAKEDAV